MIFCDKMPARGKVISVSDSPQGEESSEMGGFSSDSEDVVEQPTRRNKASVTYRNASSSSEEGDPSESETEKAKAAKRTNNVKKQMQSQIQQTVDSFYQRRNRIPEVVISDSDSESGSDGREIEEVPDSSPLKILKKGNSLELDSSPIKPTKTKLPSFSNYAYKAPRDELLTPTKHMTNSKMMESYQIFRKKYPYLTQKVILNALKTKDSITEIKEYLDSLPKIVSKTDKPQGNYRLSSLSRNSTVLSSSPLKAPPSATDLRMLKLQRERQREEERARRKADRENIKSSKVVLDSKKSISDRFLNQRRRLYREGDAEREKPISLNDSSDEEEEDESEESSDESIKEVSPPPRPRKPTKTKRYEDDDDYDPLKPKLKLRKQKEHNEKTQQDRDERRKRRHEIEATLLPEFEQDEDAGLNINEKFLKLVNNADIRDIIDLSNIKPGEAEIVIKNRPYNSINEFLKVELKQLPRSKVPHATRLYSERVVETCKQKLIAYAAIDSLVRQCFSYSKDITREIVKWGVNIEGQQSGEFSITDVNVSENDESNSDSESDSQNVSESESDEGSDSDIQVVKSSKRKQWTHKDDDDDENDDEDFNLGRKKLYKSNINLDKIKDKIGYFKKSPKLMKEGVQLKDYQQVGLNWLHLLFQKQLSCILADEMGLGKTIQVISLIAHLKQKKYPGPHLIVVPSSTLENWLREFEKFAPEIDVVPYYGTLTEREELRYVLMDEKFDVMVTTYNLATVGKLDQPFLRSFEFNTIVYDEGHMLKNAASDRYKKLTKLRAHFRVLLTGTPLQNNLKELVSLLDFILPEVFDSKMNQLQLLFDKKASTTDHEKIEGESYNPLLSQQAIAKAKVMMTPFILRRTKAQVMKDLPQKHTSIEYTDMTPHQREIYDDQMKSLNDYRKEQILRKKMSKDQIKNLPPLKAQAMNALMYLRKACLHPLLFRKHYNDKVLKVMAKSIMKNNQYQAANQEYIYEDMEVMSDFELTGLCHQFPNELGKFVLKQESYLDSGKVIALIKIITDIIAKGEKVLVFSLFTQMLDILEKVISLKNWKFLRLDGATAVETRQTMIDKFYQDKTIPIFLLSTKAGGFGINLVCATNVIIYDQSFNPHDDKQAEDRAHRVGQTKEVFVTRLICKNSIEENILQMAYNKLQLDQSMMKQPTEDILLKTVEDMLASKDSAEPEGEETMEQKISEESKENVFETNIELELVNSDDDEDIEVIEEVKPQLLPNGRGKRKRNNITYVDDIDMKGIIESDYEDDSLMTSDFEELDNDGESMKKPKIEVKLMTDGVHTNLTTPIKSNGIMAIDEVKPSIQTSSKLGNVMNTDEINHSIQISNKIQISIPGDIGTKIEAVDEPSVKLTSVTSPSYYHIEPKPVLAVTNNIQGASVLPQVQETVKPLMLPSQVMIPQNLTSTNIVEKRVDELQSVTTNGEQQ